MSDPVKKYAQTNNWAITEDASGNLIVFSRSSNLKTAMLGFQASLSTQGVFIQQAHISTAQIGGSDVTTASTTLVSSGLGVELDLHFTLRVYLFTVVQVQLSVAGEISLALYASPTAVPASGTGVGSDRAIGPTFKHRCDTANANYTVSWAWSFTSLLAVDAANFLYVAFASPIGTTTAKIVGNQGYIYTEEL